jgi:hypothetical protein
MKRILLCIASLWLSLTALTPQTARSQILIGLLLGEKVTTESFHLGIDIGVGLTNVSGISGTRVRTGLHFGLLGEWRFAERLYLQPGLLPFFNAGADDMPFKDFGLGQLDSLVSNKSATRKLNYVAVPIIVKYGFVQEKLLLGLGPQINFLTSAADHYSGVINNDISVTEDVKGQLNSIDTGIVFHAEYKRKGRYGSSVTARFFLGMTDLIKDNPGAAVHNRVFSILATVPIGGDPTRKKDGKKPKADASEEG